MSVQTEDFPFQIKKLDAKEHYETLKHYNGAGGITEDYIRVGPKGYWLPVGYAEVAPKIYNMTVKPDDVWIMSYPKSGTTWIQELVWLVLNDFDFAKAEAIPLVDRFPFLEFSMFFNGTKARAKFQHNIKNKAFIDNIYKTVDRVVEMHSPRYIKTHLPLSLLPPDLLDTCKVVYTARTPMDVAVSYYHHYNMFTYKGFTGDFKQFWNFFIENKIEWTPCFDNVKESWEKRNHPNMLFIFYEESLKDLASTVDRVVKFFGKTITDEQRSRVCVHLSFENFKKNKSVNKNIFKELDLLNKDASFVRKGKAGTWRELFDEEMTRQAEQWMADNLRDTDLRYPTV